MPHSLFRASSGPARHLRLLAAALLIPVLASCSMSTTNDTASASAMASSNTSASASAAATPQVSAESALPDDAVITYRFTDSSVPPQYHRSWVLTVTKDNEQIVVDSYGDVLADEQVPTPAQVWSQLAAGLPALQELTVSPDTQGCTGGTGEAATVDAGGTVLLDVTVYECAGVNADVAEALRAWIQPARDQFPSTDELAPPGQE